MRHIEMKYVEDKRRRKEIYKKRTKSLKKATYELTQLCDIPALMICFGQEGDVITWPESKHEIEQIAEKLGRCTLFPKRSDHNLYNFHNRQRMKELIEATVVSARELPPEKVSDLRQSLQSKLKEIREKSRILTQQSNCDQVNNDNVVEESITELETLNISDNSQGSNQTCTVDLNDLAHEKNKHDEQSKNKENGGTAFAIGSMEQDADELARKRHYSLAVEAFNWHKASMNYWETQLSKYHKSDSSNLNLSLSLAPPSTDSAPSLTPLVPSPPLASFVTSPRPINFIPSRPSVNFTPLVSSENNRNGGNPMPFLHMLMPHGIQFGSSDPANGNSLL